MVTYLRISDDIAGRVASGALTAGTNIAGHEPLVASKSTENAPTNPKAKAKARDLIYAERRNGGHPRAHKAALTRPCSYLPLALETQANVKVKGKGLRLSGVGSPTPAIQASKPLASRQIKGDLTGPARQNQPPPVPTPPAARTRRHRETSARRRPTRSRPPGPAACRPWHARTVPGRGHYIRNP
jgi:hypothetical protein